MFSNRFGHAASFVLSKPNWYSRNIRDVCRVDQLVNNNNSAQRAKYGRVRTRVPSSRRAVAREFDDGITSHWFHVYNTPEINVRSVRPPVNTSPHDGYARLIYLYSATIDTPDITQPDTPFASLCAEDFYAMITQYCTNTTLLIANKNCRQN